MNNYSMRRKINRFLNLYIKKHKELISIFLSAISIFYIALRLFYNEYFFQPKCEKYYGIPGKYFSTNINFKIISGIILITFLIFLFCLLSRKNRLDTTSRLISKHKENNCDKKYKFIIGVFTVLFLVVLGLISFEYIINYRYNESYFLNAVDFLIKHSTIICFIICLSSIFIVIFFNNGFKKVKKIKSKKLKKLLINIFSFFISFNALIIYSGFALKFQSSIDQKTNYEFIIMDQKEYVILSEYNDKYLVTSFNKKNDTYTFNTNKYKFVDMDKGTVYYKNISYPIINKGTK